MKKVYIAPRIRAIALCAESVLQVVSINNEDKPFNPDNRRTRRYDSSPIWSDHDQE